MWGEIASAGLNLASNIFGGDSGSSAKGQEDANKRNFDFAREQMEWQRQNYQNRHQWEVEDLKKAGLNPVLSAMNGAGTMGSPNSAKAESTTKDENLLNIQKRQLKLNSANTLANTILSLQKANTEKTIQARNKGVVSIPGFGSMPIDELLDRLKGGNSSAKKITTDLASIGNSVLDRSPGLKWLQKKYNLSRL